MKKIKRYICAIKDELEGAMEYAEKYICYKQTKPQWAKMYADMAAAELTHAHNLHTMGTEAMTELSWIPEKDKECWEHCIAKMAEKEAMVKLMLSK